MAVKCLQCHFEIQDDSRFCSRCGTPIQATSEESAAFTKTLTTPSTAVPLGSSIAGKYRILEEIGHGGMGIVYKAEDIKLKRMAALKFLPQELSLIPETRERFIQEARAAAALSHPNICTIYEVDESEGRPFIVMEYVEGKNLREKIKNGPLPVGEALDIALQTAEGLDKAHRKGIVHRDVKSTNIMVTDNGQVKIMDFGLAKVAGGPLITKEPKTMGTVAYMSPEQTRGERVDNRSDIWSLGVVLYEILSGELPFKGERDTSIMYSIVHEELKPLKNIKQDVPAELDKTVRRALEKKLELRYSTAAEMLEDLTRCRKALERSLRGPSHLRKMIHVLLKPQISIPGAIVLAGLGYWAFRSQATSARIQWARSEAIPQIKQLIDKANSRPPQWGQIRIAAYRLAEEAERYIPEDPELKKLWPEISSKITIETTPPGAEISIKEYSSFQHDWQLLGISPLKEIRVPGVYLRWKFEKASYETVLAVAFGSQKLSRTLDLKVSFPSGMIRVKGREISKEIGTLSDFFIDRYEVTNRQFKEFVDNGGYQKKEYWKNTFERDGRDLSWEEAVSEFKDSAGRPGPSTWQAGDYPEGQDDFPVSGVSWYEAAAYAEFAGKRIPSVYHWETAAGFHEPDFMYLPSQIIPLSNFSGDGPASVGRYQGASAFGAFDMAGNLREWCWNESMKGRAICGGAWNDINYLYGRSQQSPFDRSPRNGFRCVVYIDEGQIPDKVFASIRSQGLRDFYKEKPVSDELFQVYRNQFQYDQSALEPVVERADESSEDWKKEKVTFSAAYGKERMIAYFFLPKKTAPPYQTVLLFPGTNVIDQKSSDDLGSVRWFDFFVKDGRAVVFPIYKGTFERNDGLTDEIISPTENTQYAYVDYMVKWVKDFKRTVDYMESRDDIDISKLAYYGVSWGGDIGNVILAVECRIKVGILDRGGLIWDCFLRPEADELNYVSRVKMPILMLNGRYDSIFPYEISVKPMFDLLGTPAVDKSLKLFDTDHYVPRNELIRESLNWLDKYLGPCKRK